MKCLSIASIVLAIAGLVVGLLAAHYWLKASKIKIDPGWRSDPPQSADEARKPTEPGDPQLSQMSWTMATIKAAVESADLNKIAARLTAVAVLLSAVSSVLGALAGSL